MTAVVRIKIWFRYAETGLTVVLITGTVTELKKIRIQYQFVTGYFYFSLILSWQVVRKILTEAFEFVGSVLLLSELCNEVIFIILHKYHNDA